jgi:hypothetical protein
MAISKLKPLAMSPALHAKTRLIAGLSGKAIWLVADELYLPIAEKRADELAIALTAPTKTAKNGKAAR